MKIVSLFILFFLMISCGNKVEEIVDPETGIVLTRYEYYTDSNGQKVKDGVYTKWNNDGTLFFTVHFKDGKENGLYSKWNKKGDLILTVPLKDGIKNGEQNYYNNENNKNLEYTDSFVNGMKNGSSTLKNEGKLIYEKNYIDDLLNGVQKYYYDNSKLKAEGEMKSGIPIGEWDFYTPTHKNKTKLTFDKEGVCKELIGKWELQSEARTKSFIVVKSDGTYEYHTPIYKYDTEAVHWSNGTITIGDELGITMTSTYRRSNVSQYYKLRSFIGDTLILFSEQTENEEIYVKKL
jgi:antitoxin component YwqK of YwqJK toxin-antitoxin module